MNNFEIPAEMKNKFNWGAFFFGWLWGLFNKSYITLLQIPMAFIPLIGPIINIGLAVWFGKKGNEWALKNKHFNSLDEFIKFQNKFFKIAFICTTSVLIILCVYFKYIVFGVSSVESLFFDICAKVLTLLLISLLIAFSNIKKTFKVISLIILIISTLIIFNLNSILRYYSLSLYNNERYEDAIKVIKIMLKNTQNPVEKDYYHEAIAEAYLKNKDLNSAIFYFESMSYDGLGRYGLNMLNDLYILTDNKIKIDENFLEYRICFMNEDWACVVAEATKKLNYIKELNQKSDNHVEKMNQKKNYTQSDFTLKKSDMYRLDEKNVYLSRAIAYKKLGNNDLAENDLNTALKWFRSEEKNKYIKLYNNDTNNYWNTYYNNLKQRYSIK